MPSRLPLGRLTLALTLVAAGAAGTAAHAQQASRAQQLDPQCASGSMPLQDGCQKAIDIFNFMAPQLGISVAGGGATLGQGEVMGGPLKYSVGVRANALQGALPDVDKVTPATDQAHASDYPVKPQLLGFPVADATVGVLPAISIGLLKFGGADAMVSAAYLPPLSQDRFSIETPNGSVKMGYGGRIGVLSEGPLFPGVAITYLQRDLPLTNITGTTTDDTITVQGLSVKTAAWRLTATKHLLLLGVTAGYGQDTYKSSADLSVKIHDLTACPTGCYGTPFNFSQSLTRTNVYADLSLNLALVRFVGEVGMVSGGQIQTYNQFNGKAADAARPYASVGFRLGL
jgi:hypothetical protein